MPAVHVNSDKFDEKVLKADKPVLVDFYAEWCGPCHAAAPVLDELADASKGDYEIVKVDVDANQDLTSKYGVMSIPTVFLFRNGEEVDRKIGFSGKAGYEELLSKAR